MSEKRYIHIRNWERHQHPDTTRAKAAVIPWIKSYTAQLGDEDYLALTWAERGLLESMRLQYAANRGRGLRDSTANLARLFGQRVLRVQIERLNDAGFIQFSASKTLATCAQPASESASTEEETEREVETEQEQEQDQNHSPSTEVQNGVPTFDYDTILQDMPL